MSEENPDNAFNEEAALYQKKLSEFFPGIHISSLEEQDELRRKYSASLTPVERMAYLYQLIQVAYADILSKRDDKTEDKKIIIEELKW
jgi:hypothetical protein